MARKRKTHEKFIEEMRIANQNIDIVGTYVNSRTRVECRCKICCNEWRAVPSELLRGYGCPYCTHSRKKKTHGEFVAQLENINPKIEILGKYLGAKHKIECECKVCNSIWYTTPDHLLHGKGCIVCNTKKPRTHESFVDDMKGIDPNIEILGRYVDNKTKIECKCLTCGNKWSVLPKSLLQRHGCPTCARMRSIYRRKTHEEFVNQMKNVNPKIKIVSRYINDKTKIECKCLICDHRWKSKPSNLLNSNRCPNCAKPKGEERIERYLQVNNISYTPQQKFNGLTGLGGKPLSYDFYLFERNILIEFNGEQHNKPINYFGGIDKFKVQREHDERKRGYAKEHNIDLLEIWYYDFNNIEQILSEKLHINNTEKSA